MPCSLLAHGLCSPLGPADIAGAAIRGGLSRAQPIAWAPLLGYGEDAAPAVGHPVLGEGAHRLGELARLAWAELPDHDPVDAVLVALPLPDALRHGPEGDPLHGLREALPPGDHEPFPCGHAAPAAAIVRAEAQLAARAWRRVLVLAVDSLLDPGSLAWLAAADRLRGPECSIGLAPGEAATWWLLGPADAPGALAQVEAGYAASDGRRAPLDDADRWWRAAGGIADPGASAWVDLSGEPWRERAWGSLLPRLGATDPVSPAMSWGDLGAASALAAGCAALTVGGRHRIWSLAEDGGAGMVAISPGRAR